ncbi:MAG TPA: TonB-dependent receptor, partial [Bryobacteraceae bacterium]|nr:TonB-dependent receptor [Bryobacteraceae bacterium]
MRSVLVVAMFAALPAALTAQESRASLTGVVTDPSGAAIPGAIVSARHLATNAPTETTTNESGNYVLPFLNTGEYAITVSAQGFKAARQEKLELRISERRELNFQLEVGAAAETVTVRAEAPLLNTSNAISGTTLDSAKINDLPLLGKNPYTLAYHAAGVLHINPAGSITDRPFDNGGMDAIRIAGGRAFTNEYLLDGAPNTNVERGNPNSLSFVPPPEATGEMQVITNNYDAQYGRTGGGVISATLKSGGNEFHGSVYEYHRNRILNANTFQANRQSQPRAPFIWNQPGATVSGPVWLPGIYKGRDRSFFHFSWEGIYQNIPNHPVETVPTVLNRGGDFSDLRTTQGQPITIYDPLTTRLEGNTWVRDAFPGNRIPANRIDPVARRLLDFIPLPNFTPNAQGFQNFSPSEGLVTKERYNAYTTKIDQILTQNNRISGSYVRNRRWQTGPYYGWPVPARGPNNFQRFNQGSSLQWTSTATPTLVVTSRFGFTQHDFGNFANGGGFDPTQLGFPADQVAQAQGKFFPGISFTDYTGFGGSGNSHDTSTNWYGTVSANKVAGAHSIKFGGEVRALLDNLPNYSFASFSFNRTFTQRDYANGDALSGNAFASFLLGFPASGNANYNATPALGNRYYGLYIQDDWKITPTLTINIGGRWDYDSPTTERFNRINVGFDPSAQFATAPGLDLKGALLFASPDNRLAYKRDLNNFQPRLGMAWRFLPNTVFRSGFGISYVPQFVNPGSAGFGTSTPFVSSIDANRTPAGTLSNPFPAGLFGPGGAATPPTVFAGQNVTYVDAERVIPYIAQYSAGFQHQLPWNIVMELSYVGSQTRNLGVSRNINDLTADQLALGTTYLNQSVPNPMQGLFPGTALNGATVTRRTLLRPFPQFNEVNRTQYAIGKGWYNSLQFQFEKRLSHGLHLLMNYTWSTTMEASSYLHNQMTDDQLE